MLAYTQSDHAVNVPPLNSVDALGEQREARDARVRSLMSKKLYKDAIFEAIAEAMEDERHPLGELVSMLWSCPIRDAYDLKAVVAMREGKALGKAVLQMVAEASLYTYTDADIDGF
jgi:hypothetical protein